ncbi:MAG: hypothetical protein AVDCRST_MAG85-1796, partial [uncultured Solirubrobacteraceae bacterium]
VVRGHASLLSAVVRAAPDRHSLLHPQWSSCGNRTYLEHPCACSLALVV